MADVALRLGPETGISMLTELKTHQETQWFLVRANPPEQQTGKTENTKSKTTRKSPGQICVSPRETTAKQQRKRGQSPTQKNKLICHMTQWD